MNEMVTSWGIDSDLVIIMDAVTDLNPNAVIKIIAYYDRSNYTPCQSGFNHPACKSRDFATFNNRLDNSGLTLKLLEDQLSKHFAVVFPDAVAE